MYISKLHIIRIVYIVHCTLYTLLFYMQIYILFDIYIYFCSTVAHYILYIAQCIMYNVHCRLHNVQCTLHNVHCTLHNVQCGLYTFVTHYSLYINQR